MDEMPEDEDVPTTYVCPRCDAAGLDADYEWQDRTDWPKVAGAYQRTLHCCECGGDTFLVVRLPD